MLTSAKWTSKRRQSRGGHTVLLQMADGALSSGEDSKWAINLMQSVGQHMDCCVGLYMYQPLCLLRSVWLTMATPMRRMSLWPTMDRQRAFLAGRQQKWRKMNYEAARPQSTRQGG